MKAHSYWAQDLPCSTVPVNIVGSTLSNNFKEELLRFFLESLEKVAQVPQGGNWLRERDTSLSTNPLLGTYQAAGSSRTGITSKPKDPKRAGSGMVLLWEMSSKERPSSSKTAPMKYCIQLVPSVLALQKATVTSAGHSSEYRGPPVPTLQRCLLG